MSTVSQHHNLSSRPAQYGYSSSPRVAPLAFPPPGPPPSFAPPPPPPLAAPIRQQAQPLAQSQSSSQKQSSWLDTSTAAPINQDSGTGVVTHRDAGPVTAGPTERRRRGSLSSLFRRNNSSSEAAGDIAAAGANHPSSYTSAEPLPADYASRISRSSHDQQAGHYHHRQQALPSASSAQHSPDLSLVPPPSLHQQQQPRSLPNSPTTVFYPRPPTRDADLPPPRVSTSSILHSGNRLRKHSLGSGSVAPAFSQRPSIDGHNLSQRPSVDSGTRSLTSKMLRKSSRRQQELLALEQERQAREAHARRPAPHISLNPLPNIASFAGNGVDEHYMAGDRDGQNLASSTPRQQPAAPRATANFSRPGAPASTAAANSSSPAYVAKSSPAPTNGEFTETTTGESMRNRGRYSYASSMTAPAISSPRRIRRRKDPTPFNVLVIGAKNSGKTSFISFLRHSLALPAHKQSSEAPPPSSSHDNGITPAPFSSFTSHYLETESNGERVGLTLWDSVGLERSIVDLQLREMTAFVEAKFEDTFVEEQKVMRSPGVRDTHIHCAILVLDPARLDSSLLAMTTARSDGGSRAEKSESGPKDSLDNQMDLQVLRALWGKTTVIPVISKADTLTTAHMAYLKRMVWQSLKGNRLDPLEALDLEDDEEEEDDEEDEDDVDGRPSGEVEPPLKPSAATNAHRRQSSLSALSSPAEGEVGYLPMSIISPDPYDLPPYTTLSDAATPPGRRFPWGFADPSDPAHCDLVRLRESIFAEWRAELRELSRTKWYENWRTSRLKKIPAAPGPPAARRVRGGVTPVNSVPREGRIISPSAPPPAPPKEPPASPPMPPPTRVQQEYQQLVPSPPPDYGLPPAAAHDARV